MIFMHLMFKFINNKYSQYVKHIFYSNIIIILYIFTCIYYMWVEERRVTFSPHKTRDLAPGRYLHPYARYLRKKTHTATYSPSGNFLLNTLSKSQGQTPVTTVSQHGHPFKLPCCEKLSGDGKKSTFITLQTYADIYKAVWSKHITKRVKPTRHGNTLYVKRDLPKPPISLFKIRQNILINEYLSETKRIW